MSWVIEEFGTNRYVTIQDGGPAGKFNLILHGEERFFAGVGSNVIVTSQPPGSILPWESAYIEGKPTATNYGWDLFNLRLRGQITEPILSTSLFQISNTNILSADGVQPFYDGSTLSQKIHFRKPRDTVQTGIVNINFLSPNPPYPIAYSIEVTVTKSLVDIDTNSIPRNLTCGESYTLKNNNVLRSKQLIPGSVNSFYTDYTPKSDSVYGEGKINYISSDKSILDIIVNNNYPQIIDVNEHFYFPNASQAWTQIPREITFSAKSAGSVNIIISKKGDYSHLPVEKIVPIQIAKASQNATVTIPRADFQGPWRTGQYNIGINEGIAGLSREYTFINHNPEKVSISNHPYPYSLSINPNASVGQFRIDFSTTGNNCFLPFNMSFVGGLSKGYPHFLYPKSQYKIYSRSNGTTTSKIIENYFEFRTGDRNFSFSSSLDGNAYDFNHTVYNPQNVIFTPAFSYDTSKYPPITYASSNRSVATINSSGLATFLQTGTSTITANFAGSRDLEPTSQSFLLSIVKIPLIIQEPNRYYLKNINSAPFVLEPSIKVADDFAANHGIFYPIFKPLFRSLNTNVATVDSLGGVSIVGVGNTDIEIYQEETPDFLGAITKVTIKVSKNKAVITVPNNSYTKLVTDSAFNLNATSSNTNVLLTYTNSDPNVINVDSYGGVSIIGAGTANVVISQASDNNWDAAVSKTVNIFVNKLPSILDFPLIPSKLTTSPPFNLSVTSNNSQPIYYKSNNLSLATVDSFGLLTILKSGQTTIEASQIGNDIWSPASKTQNLIVGFSTDPNVPSDPTDPNVPSGPRFILGEKIIISNNDYYNGTYKITGVTSDGKHYFECWPDCSPTTYIGEELIGSNPFSNFGQSLDINNDGNILVVGAAKENFESEVGPKKNVGFAYIYNRYNNNNNNNNNNWYFAKRISGRNLKSFGEFGKSVAIDNGNCVAIGEPFFRNSNEEFLPFDRGYGAVHLFTGQKANLDWDWDRSLYGSSIAGSEFGYSIDLNNSGDVLVVGAPKEVTNNITGGAVYVYCKLANGWKLDGKITGSLNNERFGHSVKINSGNRIAVKATNNAHIYDYTGNLLTLSRSISTPQYGNILPTNFNKTIDINLSGNRLLVGSPNTGYGLARLFVKGTNNTVWSTITTFTGQSGYFNYGASVGLDTKSNRILIGAPDENMVYIYTGASFAFHKKIGYNEFNSKDLSRCVSPFSGIGNCVAINEDSNYFAFGGYLSGPNAEGSVLVTGRIV